MFPLQRLVARSTFSWFTSVCSTPLSETRHNYAKKSVAKKLGLPKEPKMPQTPFVHYYLEHRKEIADKNPHLRVQDIVKFLATKWLELDTTFKLKTMREYKVAKNKYLQELQEYLDSLPPEKRQNYEELLDKKKKRALTLDKRAEKVKMGRPKMPGNAYTLYLTEHMHRVGLNKTKEEMRDIVKEVSQRWRTLPPEERKPFEQKHSEMKEKYDKDLLDWEEKMVRLGRDDLVRKTTRITKS